MSTASGRRSGSVSVSLVVPQLPALSHDVASNTYGPLNPASLTSATRCRPSNVVGTLVQLCVPAGAIWIDPPATPDWLSVLLTTNWVGLLGSCASKLNAGGVSSMCTAIELDPVFGPPCGFTARLAAVQTTVCTALPLTGTPDARYDVAAPASTRHVVDPMPLGPAAALASTVTSWLTHTLGLVSFG